MNRTIKIAGIIILIGFFIGLFLLIKLYNKPHSDVNTIKPTYKLTSEYIINEFKNNEEKANSIYLDKIIQIEGTIKDIKTANGNSVIILGQGNAIETVSCNMDPAENRMVLGLKKGQKITIKGICTGFLMDVILVRSVIIKK